MHRDFGWWQAVPRKRILVNRVSGQTVRWVGPSDESGSLDAPADEGWLRFEYEDEEGVLFPLLVRLIPTEIMPLEAGNWSSHPDGLVLIVDYDRSAVLWQQETGAKEAYPPYGLWRRVDDCITDALPCWPRTGSRERPVVRVYFLGGWLNGDWRAEARRVVLPPDRNKFKPDSAWLNQHPLWYYCEAERPILLPLDTAAPAPWLFFPFPSEPTQPGENAPDVGNNVYFKKTRYVDKSKPGRCSTVPPELPLTGFEGLVPYMRSSDGNRVLFPSHGSVGFLERGKPYFSFEYSDEEFGGSISGWNTGSGRRSGWVFDMLMIFGSPRSAGGSNELEGRPAKIHGSHIPGYQQWQRLYRELLDAWLFWEGTPCTYPGWSSGLALAGADSFSMTQNYLGGVFAAGPVTSAWLAKGHDKLSGEHAFNAQGGSK